MGDLTKNISRHELKCRCGKCNFQSCDYELINVIQEACTYFESILRVDKVTLVITGPARCPDHNKSEGGAESSYHIQCGALDHYIKNITASQLYDYYDKKYPDKFGLGLYSNRVHLDTRPTKARWKV